MGRIRIPFPVKYFVGIIFQDFEFLFKILPLLEKKLGLIDIESPTFPFSHTRYYEEEMGKNLKKKFFSFKKLYPPELLTDLKHWSNRLEEKFSKKGFDIKQKIKRTVNIDPGYIELSKVILATTKNYTHRIYLSKGIYAEVTLNFKSGSYIPLPWTYPDYRTPSYIEFFNKMRKIYTRQLKEQQLL